MRVPLAAVALVGAATGNMTLAAPAAAQLRGPENAPPASYKGVQFVDQTGCLYLRAGFGVKTVWVPMVNDKHEPICGMKPTATGPAPAGKSPTTAPPATATAPAPPPPVPQTTAARPKSRVVAVKTIPQARPRIVFGYEVLAIDGTMVACANNTPVIETAVLRGGGTAFVCTHGDGTLTGWHAPRFGTGLPPGYTPPTPANMRGARRLGPVTPASPGVASAAIPAPPPGWKLAWTDGRLNPMRGIGTPAGQATQDRVWTRTTPARPIVPETATGRAQVTRVPAAAPPAAPPATTQLYVQIGAFAVPANARRASVRITMLGLPAANDSGRNGALQIVYAGPFASYATAQAARSQLVAAGYRDAFIR